MKEEKKKRVLINFDLDVYEKVKKQADNKGLNITAFIRMCVFEQLEKGE